MGLTGIWDAKLAIPGRAFKSCTTAWLMQVLRIAPLLSAQILGLSRQACAFLWLLAGLYQPWVRLTLGGGIPKRPEL